MCHITVISGIKPSSVTLGRSVDNIKTPSLLRKREMILGYLREVSTLRSGSRPGEVGMSDGRIRRGTPDGTIGTCMWTKGNPS